VVRLRREGDKMELIYDICVGATIGLYSGAIVYVAKKIIEDRRLKRLDKGLNFVEEYEDASKDELTDEGRERLRRRGIEMEVSE
jgi:hypothetical protein